jgi:hypothetical protein
MWKTLAGEVGVMHLKAQQKCVTCATMTSVIDNGAIAMS